MATTPRESDVLFGRGPIIMAHPGNQRLRQLVDVHKTDCLAAKRSQRREFALRVFDAVHALNPPGKFLMEDTSDGGNNALRRAAAAAVQDNDEDDDSSSSSKVHVSLLEKIWVEVDDNKAIAKILHRLREPDPAKKSGSGEGGHGRKKKKTTKKNMAKKKKGSTATAKGSKEDNIKSPRTSSVDSSEYFTEEIDVATMNDRQETKDNDDDSCNELLLEAAQIQSLQAAGVWDDPSMLLQRSLIDYAPGEGNVDVSMLQHYSLPTQTINLDGQNVDNTLRQYNVDNSINATVKMKRSASTTEYSSVDEDLDTFLQEFTSRYDDGGNDVDLDFSDELQQQEQSIQCGSELTLRQWIRQSVPIISSATHLKSDDGHTEHPFVEPSSPRRHVTAALSIALKLTQCLFEAERDERSGRLNPIPLESIAAENVLVRVVHDIARDTEDIVEYAWFISVIGDSEDAGCVMSRLLALGVVLYELLSGEEPPLQDDPPTAGRTPTNDMLAMNEMNLNIDVPDRPRKIGQRRRRPSLTSDGISKCVSRLEALGIPWSLRSLLANLLDCSNGDLSGDDAYSSLADLQLDLQLMINDPSKFLEDIKISSGIPPLPISSKLFGREEEIDQLEKAYQRYLDGMCNGITIQGSAGVGKSVLLTHVLQQLTSRANGYYVSAKYDQTNLQPLSTIACLFNELCDVFVQHASQDQLLLANSELASSLGSQASLLAGVVPSLSRIMPSCGGLSPPAYNGGIESALSLEFLFTSLLGVISSHSTHITLVLDDIHWIDTMSLKLVESLISSTAGFHSVFFTFSYRDDEVNDYGSLKQGLNSIPSYLIESIKLQNMTVDGVNSLLSDELHISPRITRRLSSTIHHKTSGNPLFLRQLLDSLKEQGYIYFDLRRPRWNWDLAKIQDLKISDDVVSHLIKEMQRLPDDLQLALKTVACIGGSVKSYIINILSSDIQVKHETLQQVVKRGFVDCVDGNMYRFAHDKIQQSAYELMTEHQRREHHMSIGLALCVPAMTGDGIGDDELYFTAVNQVNHGGPSAVLEPSQMSILATLNLSAGKRTVATFCDFNTAYSLFKHGISFLGTGDGHWNSDYQLSIDLYDAISEAACVLNDESSVKYYTEKLISHARCYDDKLNCLYEAVKLLRQSDCKKESVEASFSILNSLGESKLRPMNDPTLLQDMQSMNTRLRQMKDSAIINMPSATLHKKHATLMKIYSHLNHILHFIPQSSHLLGATSLRMVELVFIDGTLSHMAPLAFAFYVDIQASRFGELDLGCRLGGRLALALVEKQDFSRYKASVICIVCQAISWAYTPLQSIVEAQISGQRCAQQSGDYLNTSFNWILSIIASFVAGKCLVEVRKDAREYSLKKANQKAAISSLHGCILHCQACSLIEGLRVTELDHIDGVLCKMGILAEASKGVDATVMIACEMHKRIAAFLFRRFDGIALNVKISDIISSKKTSLRIAIIFFMFMEGLVAFQLARRTSDTQELLRVGDFVLEKMTLWNEHCPWNFENKKLLLAGERKNLAGDFAEAEQLYIRSVKSAKIHKFIHEEAMASELAGDFFRERGIFSKSYSFYSHSVECYKKWGALAVATRVETVMQHTFGIDLVHSQSIDEILSSVMLDGESSTKKRQDMG